MQIADQISVEGIESESQIEYKSHLQLLLSKVTNKYVILIQMPQLLKYIKRKEFLLLKIQYKLQGRR